MTTDIAEDPVDPHALGRGWVETDRYALIQEIASGGGGRISIALDRKLGRRIALKHPLEIGGARRLEREALVMARLEHPSIVPVHDAGRDADGTPFYAMKLLGGPNLSERIKQASRFEQRLALLRVVGAVADAMAYAHTRGVIHRDLKPANVVVGEFGEVAVIDWGLAKAIDDPETTPQADALRGDLTSDGAVVGTPAYMAPEQAAGEPVGAAADVYALGAMLYQVLCGELPYGRIDAETQLARLVAGPPPPVEDREPRVPPDLAAIVAKAMAREPSSRYPSARELADDLHRYETGRMVAAHRYSLATRARRWLRRHAVAVATSAALVAIGGSAAALVVGGGAARTTCVGLDRPAAAAWDPAARAAIARAFAGRSPATLAAVTRALDDRASRLTAMRLDVCRARESADESAAIADERIACLDQRVGELRAVAGAIARLAPDQLVQAPVMLGAMGAVDECADLRHLRDAPLPTSPTVRTEVLAVDERLTAMEADDLAGHVRGELAVTPALLGRALATGHAPLVARALEDLGEALQSNGRTEPAEAALHASLVASARVGDERRRGRALLQLALITAQAHGRTAEADQLAEETAAIGERIGDDALRAGGLAVLVRDAAIGGDAARSIALARQMVAIEEGSDVPPIRRARALEQLGQTLTWAGRFDEAWTAEQQALAALRAVAGPDHEFIAGALDTLGIIAGQQGKYDVAIDYLRQAAAMYERIVGPDAHASLGARQTLGEFLKMSDRYDEAATVLTDVRDRLARQPSPNRGTLADTENSLASVLALQGKLDDALAAYRRALALRDDPGSRGAGMDRYGIGSTLVELHRAQEALPELASAARVLDAVDAGHFYDAETHLYIAEALLAGGDGRGASAELARARAGLEAEGDDNDKAQLELDTAKASWAGGDRAAAIRHARAARDHLVAAGPSAAARLRELDAWAATHR
jgi:tetratricopeptide (TPR) repeat protein